MPTSRPGTCRTAAGAHPPGGRGRGGGPPAANAGGARTGGRGGKGELLATAAVNSGREQDLRPVVLNVASNLPASTKVGDYVDLWVVPKEGVASRPTAQAPATAQPGQNGQGTQSGPGDQSGQTEGAGARRVATGLVIASVGETSKGLISGPGTGVEVKVPEASLAAVLSAVGQEGSLVLVPTGQEAPAEKAS